jgi:hypothetical protein
LLPARSAVYCTNGKEETRQLGLSVINKSDPEATVTMN